VFGVYLFLNADISTLYASSLINRHWCQVVVQSLWAEPFSLLITSWAARASINKHNRAERLISTYLACKENGATFDYPVFLKKLDLLDVDFVVHESSPEIHEHRIVKKALTDLLATRCTGLTILTIEEMSYSSDMCQCTSIDLFPTNGTFWTLTDFVYTYPLPKAKILNTMAATCQSLKRLAISLEPLVNGDNALQDAVALARLLNKQTRLQTFELARCSIGSENVMRALCSQAGSLRHVTFIAIPFGRWKSLDELATCNRLETLAFQACYGLSIEHVVSLTFPYLLSSWLTRLSFHLTPNRCQMFLKFLHAISTKRCMQSTLAGFHTTSTCHTS